jgi:hypothetical protein
MAIGAGLKPFPADAAVASNLDVALIGIVFLCRRVS